MAGVHYPTDNTGGRILGDAVAEELLTLMNFRVALAAAGAEIQSARPRPLNAVAASRIPGDRSSILL